MDIAYNKTDGVVLPITNTRISASEYNQIAGSLMNIITSAGLTPDSQDNAQLLNALGPRIVETYSNGTSWYRVYSDGWCEQGGKATFVTAGTTVTFLKEFKDSNFSLTTGANAGDSYTKSLNISTYSASSFTGKATTDGNGSISTPYWWRASGYIS